MGCLGWYVHLGYYCSSLYLIHILIILLERNQTDQHKYRTLKRGMILSKVPQAFCHGVKDAALSNTVMCRCWRSVCTTRTLYLMPPPTRSFRNVTQSSVGKGKVNHAIVGRPSGSNMRKTYKNLTSGSWTNRAHTYTRLRASMVLRGRELRKVSSLWHLEIC